MAESAAGGGRTTGAVRPVAAAVWRGSVAFAAALWVAHLAVQLAPASLGFSGALNRSLEVAIPLLVSLVMGGVARRAGSLGSRRADAWWLLAFAYLCFTAGEVTWVVFGVGLNQGLPSYASAGVYLLFYVLFLAGALRLPAAPLARSERAKIVLDTGIILLAAILADWVLSLRAFVGRPDADPVRIGIATAYQVGDLMVLWALVELFLRRRERATQSVYTLLAASAALRIVTDLAWGRLIFTGDTTFNLLLDPGWSASHVLAALAAVRFLANPEPQDQVARPTAAPVSRASLYLAYAAGIAAFAVVIAKNLAQVTPVVAALAAAILGLIALRHIIALRENSRLWAQLRVARDDLEAKVSERTAELHRANVDLQTEVSERQRAQDATQRRLKELTLLSAVTEVALEARDEDELFARVTLAIRGTLYPDNCGFMLVDQGGTALRHTPSFHSLAPPSAFRDIPLGQGVTGRVAASGVPLRVADTSADPGYVACDPTMRSELCVPLRVGDRIAGVLDAESDRPDAFTEDGERVLATVAGQVAAAMERLRASEALRRSERNYREVFNATSEAIFVHDAATGAILDVNQTMLVMYGYTRAEALRVSISDLSVARTPITHQDEGERIRKTIEEGPQVFEWLAKRKDGSEFWVEVTLRKSPIGGKDRVLAVVRDIGERRQAEEALRLSEERFRAMVQQAYDFITVLDAGGKIIYESPSTGRILGYGPGGLTGRNGFTLIHPEDFSAVREALERIARSGSSGKPTQYRVRRADGEWIYVESLGNNLLANPAVGGIVLTSREITERKRAEEEIRRKLKELTVLNAVAELAVQAEDEEFLIARATEIVREALYPDDCGVLLVDDGAGALRFTPSYRQGENGSNREPIPLGTGITGVVAATGTARRTGDVTSVPEYIGRLPGMRSEICLPMKVGQRVIGVVNAESRKPDAFTEHDEAVLATIAGQLATAIGRLRAWAAHRESEERLRRLADAAFEGIGITDQGRIVDANRRLSEILGYEPDDLVGRHVMEFVAPQVAEEVERVMQEGRDEPYEHLAIRKDGSIFPIETQGRRLPGSGTMRVAAVRDITERKRTEQRIQRQLERLAALRAIDAAITGGFDLPDTLELFLAHLLAQLRVDAADVLLFEPSSNVLTFTAGKGFRSDDVRGTRLGLGECYAGLAALERRTILVPDLVGKPDGDARASLAAKEEFRICFAAPLVAKGHVHGVLEVFGRRSFEPDGEWMDYLETLAGQLAIAIDNRTLFEDLQQSNAELAQAYDTTLEGWSKALELRDRETHGHAARVVELTVRLASVMGVRSKDLVHVRRGALLHDIGKMGIPDTILLKPGPLDEEEWKIMRRHPQLAFDLLLPIGFLRPAIDIPYCHHERWDGKGYPRGLAGDGIPLAARAFAVIDTWDALCFPRPYREAWPEERARAFLRDEAGTRFDPAVVEAFLRMSD